MTESEFKNQYLGEFPRPTERELALKRIASIYHERCDNYDEWACSGMRNGVPMPVDNTEFQKINKNALKVLKQCKTEGSKKGFTSKEVWDAIRRYCT